MTNTAQQITADQWEAAREQRGTQFMKITDEAAWLEKRKQYVTSTEIASLFGLQMPYMPSAFELWHIKHGNITSDFEQNNHMLFGKLMEDVICTMAKTENPDWEFSPFPYFAYNDEDKIGSSFDRIVSINGVDWLAEIKTISYAEYKKKFIEMDGFITEAPEAYEFQMQTELELANDRDFAGCVMIVFIADTRTLKYLFRRRDNAMCMGIRAAVKEFWQTTEAPQPDYSIDKSVLAKVAAKAIGDNELNATGDIRLDELCAFYKASKALAKQEEENAATYYAEILHKIGTNKKAYTQAYRVTASDIAPSEGKQVTQDMVGTYIGQRAGYKRLTITEIK